jgi:hypothetical protein
MKITLDWLKEKSACSAGVEWFQSQKETDSLAVLNALIKADKLDWANWTIVRLMTHKQQTQYAVHAAEQVIGIYEKQYPDDNRPRQAIEATKKCIDDPSEENKRAAEAAAWAAGAAEAAEAAWAAAWAAGAVEAAGAAAGAAEAAAEAAWAAGAAARAVEAAARAVEAAGAAAWAAGAAARAAEAAWAAARAAWAAGAAWAARAAMKKKILKYGIKLLAG